MKKPRPLILISLLSFVALLPSLAKAQSSPPESKPQNWQTFSSADGRFSVDMPGAPKVSSEVLDAGKQIILNRIQLGTLAAYAVTYSDQPDFEGNPELALKMGVMAATMRVSGPDKMAVSEIVIDGYPARSITATTVTGLTLRSKVVVVGPRLFTIACVTPRAKSIGTENVALYESAAKRFLDSFHLTSADEELNEIDLWLKNHKGSRIVYGAARADGASKPDDSAPGSLPKAKDNLELGCALVLAKPAYPPLAKAAHASGTVGVQVIIDETGTVVAARPITGHPLLYAASVQAARECRFTPPRIDGKPVCVIGVISFNFVAQ